MRREIRILTNHVTDELIPALKKKKALTVRELREAYDLDGIAIKVDGQRHFLSDFLDTDILIYKGLSHSDDLNVYATGDDDFVLKMNYLCFDSPQSLDN